MTSAQDETAAADPYADAYKDSSAWCHGCQDKPSIDTDSTASPSGVRILKAGTTWDCPTCKAHWIVARIEEVGLRWMTTGPAA